MFTTFTNFAIVNRGPFYIGVTVTRPQVALLPDSAHLKGSRGHRQPSELADGMWKGKPDSIPGPIITGWWFQPL